MELKEDEQAPDGQRTDVAPSNHPGNQSTSRPYVNKRRPSIAGQLAASRLIKKARLALLPKSGISRPAATKPTSNNTAAPEIKPEVLSTDTIDVIFERSCSTLSFATRLMTRLFDKTELLKCRNVHGRSAGRSQHCNPDEALDERRVNIIRRLVEEKVGASNRTWKECVRAMNKKICNIKANFSQEKQLV